MQNSKRKREDPPTSKDESSILDNDLVTNHTAEEHAKPAVKQLSTPSNNEGKEYTTSNELIGKKAGPTALNPEDPVADSDNDSEVEFLEIRSVASAANSCLSSPSQDQEPKTQLYWKNCGSNVLWVEEADPTTVPYADPSHFRKFVREIQTDSRPANGFPTGTPNWRGLRSMRQCPQDETNQEYSAPNDLMTAKELTRQESAKGNDIELVRFQAVERINVNEEDAGAQVSEMRRYGIPFVLVGHPLWPAFASRWIEDVPTEGPANVPSRSNQNLDIENLISDIGEEDVPIVEKNYDERNPVKSVIKASDFLQYHWFDNDGTSAYPSREDQIYMQQWQFTSSPVAEILCGDDDCRPPDVLEEDLLSYWLNDGGNPYQYLFMGSTGTMSKLHKDPGGLDILIAPIVGEKECVLVHRDDGKYLYDCRSNLDKIDLNRFPLTECARIWKTVIKAGEILFMPHDTYHQCRNVTSCMSYHRLHLDYVNLPGFLDSLFQRDSGETIEHEEILWNCAFNLCEKVDDYVEEFRSEDDSATSSDRGVPIEKYVTALRFLRPVCMHLIRSFDDFGALSALKYTRENWKDHIREIDFTLFNYRHRNDENQPRFRPVALQGAEDGDETSDKQDVMTTYKGKWRLDARLESLSSALTSLPRCKQEEENLVISDKVLIKPSDRLQVRLPEVNRRAIGVVKHIREMEGLFVSYEELPTEFDEFLPISKVRSAASAARAVSSALLRPAIWGNPTSKQNVRCIPSGSKKVSYSLSHLLIWFCSSISYGRRFSHFAMQSIMMPLCYGGERVLFIV
jgi:hypothetical protein